MNIALATTADDANLKSFYESFPIAGSVELKVKRPHSFFDIYKLQSSDYETHILRNSAGQICGCATLLFREGNLLGSPTTMGFATDLRIAPTREAIVGWSRHFLPVIKSATAKRNTKLLFSMISGADAHQHNAFIRPRARRRNIPIYSLVRRFEIVTIIGHLPFFYHKLKTIKLVRAEINDIEPLAHYLDKKSRRRLLSFPYSSQTLLDRTKNWPGFSLESFLLAKDSQNNIIGCTAPWSPNHVQQLYAQKYSGFAQTAQTASKIGSWFNITNPLPSLDSEFPLEFLTHFQADNPDIFTSLLEECYRTKSPKSSLVYPHYWDFPQTQPPKQFIVSRTQYGLYSIWPSENLIEGHVINNPIDNPPDIELCFL